MHGDLDLVTAQQFLDVVLETSQAHPRHLIVADLTDVPFVDSSGISAIVKANNRTRDASSHLVIANPSPNAMTAFETTGVDGYVDISQGWAASSG